MPTTPRKARILLEKGEATVVKRTPFVIQLTKPTGENKQPITLGVDAGSRVIGLSAVTEKKEVFSAEVELRTDEVKLNQERAAYRKSRRSRKTPYRQARFLNRTKPKGWLAPSVQHKVDNHVKLVDKVHKILPIIKVNVELASFDIQKFKNPDIEGVEYQQGPQLGFENVRAYVLFRDCHTCQGCKKSKLPVDAHHIVHREHKGSDLPENLITLCKDCHHQHHSGVKPLKFKKPKMFQHETFMTIARPFILKALKNKYSADKIEECYGYETKFNRKALGLEKSHNNDAFIIAKGDKEQIRCREYKFKFVRKNNRKLYKGARSHIRNTTDRVVYGFCRFDKVLYKGIECFIFGRYSKGYFCLRSLNGDTIKQAAPVKDIKRLEGSRTLLCSLTHKSF